MTAKPEDFLLQAWKQQLDLGLRLIESVADTTDLAQLVKLQAEWTRANVQKCREWLGAAQKFYRIPTGKLPENNNAGAELPPVPAKPKPSRRAAA